MCLQHYTHSAFLKSLNLVVFALLLILNVQAQDPETENYKETDKLIQMYDSLGQYSNAMTQSKRGLSQAHNFQNVQKESYYNLRLAKYYYLLGNSRAAIMHFRLYAVLREQEVSNLKNMEMIRLEDAYLEQLTTFANEIELNNRFITRLQKENTSYDQSLQWIYTASKIGAGAIVLIFGIILYDRRNKKKKGEDHILKENKDLERLRDIVEKQESEELRNQEEIRLLKGKQQRQAWYTRQIQRSLLPNSKKINEHLKNSFILQYSMSSTNGDFYVINQIDGKTVLVVLDCPGHGPDAAYNTVIAYHHLQEILQSGITAPSMILTMMDQKIKHSLEETGLDKNEIHGSKIAVCEIRNETKEIEYAGAGFPLFYVHLDKIHIEKGNHFPVGDAVFSDPYYSSTHIRLSSDDMVYFITDGFYRQLGGKRNKKFMRGSLTSLLKSMHHQSLSEQKFILDKVLTEWKGKNPLTDDVLVVGIKM